MYIYTFLLILHFLIMHSAEKMDRVGFFRAAALREKSRFDITCKYDHRFTCAQSREQCLRKHNTNCVC